MSKSIELIMHIGFAKCASTYLQYRVFPLTRTYKYIHKHSKITGAFWGSPAIWESNSMEETLYSLYSGAGIHGTIVSDERMSLYTPFVMNRIPKKRRVDRIQDPDLLSLHLNMLYKLAKKSGYTGFKVVLIVRDQASLLASLYAQNSWGIWNAGQKDFEKQVYAIIDKERRYYSAGIRLDYLYLYEKLCEVLGKSNVLIMGIQTLKKDEEGFLDNLGTFINEPDLRKMVLTHHTDSERKINVRSKKPGEWPLRYGRVTLPIFKHIPRLEKWNRLELRRPYKKIRLTNEIKNAVSKVYYNSNSAIVHSLHGGQL